MGSPLLLVVLMPKYPGLFGASLDSDGDGVNPSAPGKNPLSLALAGDDGLKI